MALGYKSVSECQNAISSNEFTEWQAYNELEPFGNDRFPVYFGTIAATIANSSPNRKRNSKVLQWFDFFPPYGVSKHQTTDEQISIVEQLNMAFGGVDKRGEKASSA